MHTVDADLQAELEERLRFETLLAELSARFVNLPPSGWARRSRTRYAVSWGRCGWTGRPWGA